MSGLGCSRCAERRRICFGRFSWLFSILWLLGFSLHIGGGLIHLLLVVALVVLVFNLVTGRRRVF